MLKNLEPVNSFLASFKTYEQNLNGQKDMPLHKVRRQAMDYVQENGFPTTRQEEWRFTDVKPIFEKNYEVFEKENLPSISRDDIKKYRFSDWEGVQLVFLNGIYQADLSDLSASADNILVKPISEMIEDSPEKLQAVLKRQDDSFNALNTAFMQDGLFIESVKNSDLEKPVHLLYLSGAENTPSVSYPRNIVLIGENSKVKIIESYHGFNNNSYFTNTLTDIYLKQGSSADFIKIQNENLNSSHIGSLFVSQEKDSSFNSFSINLGGSLVRNSIISTLSGEGSSSNLYGLYLGHEDQHIDNFTIVDHAKAHCTSNELYQGILTDKARGVFSGKILVRQDAQKTDAEQSNNCLLLSEDARINSKPQLEIYADDVKCTHGATVGQLDEQQIFYFQSRGIGLQEAKNILTFAFAEKVVDKIEIDTVREKINGLISERLEGDLNISL